MVNLIILDHFQDINQINYEKYYDYETNSYLQNFKTPEAQNAMKRIHEEYYAKQEKSLS